MPWRSMTGFGQATALGAKARIQVDVRGVNHRYLDVAIRLPREYGVLEDLVRACVSRFASRGRVDVTIKIDLTSNGRASVTTNWELLDGVITAFGTMSRRYDWSLSPMDMFRQAIALPGILSPAEWTIEPGELQDDVVDAVNSALRQFADAKAREGARLQEDLARKVTDLVALQSAMSYRASVAVDAFSERLRKRLNSLSLAVDESRLLSEIVIFAERSSVDEELVRFSSHLSELQNLYASNDVVGRRLDFLVQELHREINTIGAKSVDSQLSKAVVEAKVLVEQMREQVQNLE